MMPTPFEFSSADLGPDRTSEGGMVHDAVLFAKQRTRHGWEIVGTLHYRFNPNIPQDEFENWRRLCKMVQVLVRNIHEEREREMKRKMT